MAQVLSCLNKIDGEVVKIFILNVFSRNSLAAINALNQSYEIIGGDQGNSSLNFLLEIFKSRRLKDLFWYQNPKESPDGFKNDILAAVKKYKPDAIMSTGTTTTDLLSYYKKEIIEQTECKVLVDDFEALGRLTDKLHIYDICKQVGVPVPKTVSVENIETLSELVETKDLEFPILIKPRNSYAAKGVRFFHSMQEITDFIYSKDCHNASRLGAYVAQEKITGTLHDVTSCAHKGSILSILTQERLVSLYDFGGGGIVNRTTYEPRLMKYAEKIICHMNFSGIALFDFIKSGDEYYLIECNPKIWGTTQLTIEAGNNVVQQLVDSQILGKIEREQHPYEVGLVYKWIFPECIAHWFQRPINPFLIARRIKNTFKHYDGSRTLNNLKLSYILHLIGIIINRIGRF